MSKDEAAVEAMRVALENMYGKGSVEVIDTQGATAGEAAGAAASANPPEVIKLPNAPSKDQLDEARKIQQAAVEEYKKRSKPYEIILTAFATHLLAYMPSMAVAKPALMDKKDFDLLVGINIFSHLQDVSQKEGMLERMKTLLEAGDKLIGPKSSAVVSSRKQLEGVLALMFRATSGDVASEEALANGFQETLKLFEDEARKTYEADDYLAAAEKSYCLWMDKTLRYMCLLFDACINLTVE